MRNSLTVKGMFIGILAVATTVLLAMTLVLGLTGAAGASTWTGTIGIVLLTGWLLGINTRPRTRTRPAVVVPPPPRDKAKAELV